MQFNLPREPGDEDAASVAEIAAWIAREMSSEEVMTITHDDQNGRMVLHPLIDLEE